MQLIAMPLGFILFLFAGSGAFGQGSPVPLNHAERVPNISIRVDMAPSA